MTREHIAIMRLDGAYHYVQPDERNMIVHVQGMDKPPVVVPFQLKEIVIMVFARNQIVPLSSCCSVSHFRQVKYSVVSAEAIRVVSVIIASRIILVENSVLQVLLQFLLRMLLLERLASVW